MFVFFNNRFRLEGNVFTFHIDTTEDVDGVERAVVTVRSRRHQGREDATAFTVDLNTPLLEVMERMEQEARQLLTNEVQD